MTNWQRHIELYAEFEAYRNDTMDIHNLSGIVAGKIAMLRSFAEEYIEKKRIELVEEFKLVAESKEASAEDFDSRMTELYDWGDTRLDMDWNGKKVCWINTVFAPPRRDGDHHLSRRW
jgi:hypothetical protein